MSESTIIAVLGAESTGKSRLSEALGAALAADGVDVAVVPENLRKFCAAQQRTPRADEQFAVAREQTRQIALAAARHAVVIADTTALMTAVYSEHVFGDSGLVALALREHKACRLTLLMGLDLPWVPDGIQRDGEHVREPVDTRLRSVLHHNGIPFSMVYGVGDSRVRSALQAVRRVLWPTPVDPGAPRWRWACRRCGDAGCAARPCVLAA